MDYSIFAHFAPLREIFIRKGPKRAKEKNIFSLVLSKPSYSYLRT